MQCQKLVGQLKLLFARLWGTHQTKRRFTPAPSAHQTKMLAPPPWGKKKKSSLCKAYVRCAMGHLGLRLAQTDLSNLEIMSKTTPLKSGWTQSCCLLGGGLNLLTNPFTLDSLRPQNNSLQCSTPARKNKHRFLKRKSNTNERIPSLLFLRGIRAPDPAKLLAGISFQTFPTI